MARQIGVEAHADAALVAHERAIGVIAEQQRREADRLAVIGPISTLSNEAWNLTKWGCITAVIFPIVSLPLWLLGLRKSRKALSYSQVPGDSEYRQLARKAFTWAAIPAGIVIIGGGLYILAALIAVITGNY